MGCYIYLQTTGYACRGNLPTLDLDDVDDLDGPSDLEESRTLWDSGGRLIKLNG